MRAVLEVRGGPQAGRKIVMRSGQVMQVGRAPQADLSFPDDSFMSGLHCVLQCGVKLVTVTDHGSTNGILVNGSRAKSVTLKSGDEILAGRTSLLVRLQDDHKVAHLDEASLAGRSLLSVLRAEFQPLYAILDAARDKQILALLRESGPECQSLFEGEPAKEMAEVAPYLVRLPRDSPLLKSLEALGFAKSWGVFLTSDLPLAELRNHLRSRLEATLPDGQNALFRFYDPRVLRVFLPKMGDEEVVEFFGPVTSFLVEDEAPSEYLVFQLGSEGLATKKLVLRGEAR